MKPMNPTLQLQILILGISSLMIGLGMYQVLLYGVDDLALSLGVEAKLLWVDIVIFFMFISTLVAPVSYFHYKKRKLQ